MDKLVFAEVDWESLEKEGVSKELVKKALEEMVPTLFYAHYTSKENYLPRETLAKVRENEQKLEKLEINYAGLRGLIQRLFAEQILNTAQQVEPQFSTFHFLVKEAEKRGLIREWVSGPGKRAPREIWQMRTSVYNPRSRESQTYLPSSWRYELHREVSQALRDYGSKCREEWKKSHPKPEVPSSQDETGPTLPSEAKVKQSRKAKAHKPNVKEEKVEVTATPADEQTQSTEIQFREDLETQGKVAKKETKPKGKKRSRAKIEAEEANS